MLISIDSFGGVAPKIIDPSLLPAGKSQMAKNVRTDKGGLTPICEDMPVETQSRAGVILSVYRYQDGKFFSWLSDVDAVTAPVSNDSHKRVYFTENGEFRVTDKNTYKQGGTEYPMVSYNPSPPAPETAPIVASTGGKDPVTTLTITNNASSESNGTYDLLFTGGGGTGAAGTYTVLNSAITMVSLTTGGGYTSNPTVSTQSGGGSIVASGVRDATLIETRGYVYTLVNGYGAEGPPSPVSELVDVYDGDLVNITGLDTSADSDYNITKKRIYRLNQSSSGSEYQFVAEIGIALSSYDDEIEDASLGELLASAEWDGPPIGIKGIISLPNGSLAGFVDNILCFSVPYYPHAWPVSYQRYVDKPIVALGAFGTTVAVLTSGRPYLAVGSHPSNVVMEAMDLGHACMSKRGTVQAGDVIVYPAPDGLVAVGPSVREVLTDDIISREDWNEKYNPSSITAFYWEGHYVAFCNIGRRNFGFIFNIKTKELTDLTFYATAGYRDPGTGILFLVK